jgi:hypothetical protein
LYTIIVSPMRALVAFTTLSLFGKEKRLWSSCYTIPTILLLIALFNVQIFSSEICFQNLRSSLTHPCKTKL